MKYCLLLVYKETMEAFNARKLADKCSDSGGLVSIKNFLKHIVHYLST